MTFDFAAIAVLFLTVVFYAGMSFSTLQKMRRELSEKGDKRDINNCGAKINEISHKIDDRYLVLVIVMMLAAPEDKEYQIAQLLLNAGLRR